MAAVVAIMGPIGSGKTAQANMLAEAMGWRTFSTGQVLRDHIEEPGVDPQVVSAIKEGHLVPSEYVHAIVLRELKRIPADAGIVLDGSPRKPLEVDQLNQDLPALGRKLDLVIFLQVGREEAERRLAQRGRHDDNPETIKVRWAAYERDTLPTVEVCRQQGLVREVDAEATPDQVHQRIVEVLRVENLA